MTQKRQMDLEMKCLLCELRIDGASIYEIASRIDRTPQGVQRFIALLPHGANPELALDTYPRDFRKQVCRRYLETRSTMSVAVEFDLSTDDVEDILGVLALRPPAKANGTYYPKVAEWINSHGYSVKRFAAAIGVKNGTLRAALCGNQGVRISYDVAEKISQFTGLKFSEIYQVQLENMEPEEKEAFAVQLAKTSTTKIPRKKTIKQVPAEKAVSEHLKREEGETDG